MSKPPTPVVVEVVYGDDRDARRRALKLLIDWILEDRGVPAEPSLPQKSET